MNLVPLLFALAASSLHQGTPPSQDNPQVRKEIETRLSQFVDAYKRKDIKAIGALLAPDFVAIQVGMAPINRAQALADYKRELESSQSVLYVTFNTEKVTVNGARATSEGTTKRSFTMKDPSQKLRIIAISGRARTGWIKKDGQWIAKRSEAWDIKVTIDGKPVTLKPPAATPESKTNKAATHE